jgi:hypothetical protein
VLESQNMWHPRQQDWTLNTSIIYLYYTLTRIWNKLNNKIANNKENVYY